MPERRHGKRVAGAYMDKNPEVEIQVQVTSWDEYWTKLDAAAESGQLPDIFWMHTNQILKYADYGKLEDVTDLYDDVEPDYYTTHFSDISLANARGSDGRMYGVPKEIKGIRSAWSITERCLTRQEWLTPMSPGRGMT
ncbi:MAG: extracellular solute-binding protein [Enterocloster clostridioformis]